MMLLSLVVLATGCKKDDDGDRNAAPTVTAAKSFANLEFTSDKAYFSTDGTMTTPVDSNSAKLITNKIDITYIYNYDYQEPGFFDPVARSQNWYWDDYELPWLSTAVKTRYYYTTLTKADFNAAKADQSKIAAAFNRTSTVIAPHDIFPTGSCIGGRQSATSYLIGMGSVWAFKNTATGKKGLLYIRNDQHTGWPYAVISNGTKVDIIREN